ncbi:thiamine pyrophosphate-binding protein [Vibrio quintilis]|uniref:pyruvate decarboxylase n=1 Tax=Vibrio quintilis TaxID=1117707 RepID=A0A1M7Z1S8_9VIBR|nr:thiamine pyrophosphate-binding protein [Vibrio quintilis]SHO58918.1 Indole-3-pyruvate decarboxylase [Vibrio quintilis]
MKPNLLSKKDYHKHFRCRNTAMASAETVYSYLNKRLAEIGVKRVMAIPGDYIAEWVETLDDEQQNQGLVRVHPNNEMLATYAADGYGRAANGETVGCVAFTYGVGALNAVQAFAGAHVEQVPLVMVNGSPSNAQFNSQRDQGILWHHMFDGSQTDLKIFQQVSEIAVRIDNPAYAPDLIDYALTACITESKPVYIEIANTLGELAVQPVCERPRLKRSPVEQSAEDLAEAANYIWHVLTHAKNLVVMGGVELARQNLQDKFTELCDLLEAPYVTSLLGKGVIDETQAGKWFCGVYNGRNSQQNVQALIKRSDVLFSLGVLETDFNFTGVASADFSGNNGQLPISGQIEARLGAVKINDVCSKDEDNEVYWGNIELAPLLDWLIAKAKSQCLKGAPFQGLPDGTPWDIPSPEVYDDNAQITWDSFKSYLAHQYLDTFSPAQTPVVLADTGLSFYALNNLKVPKNGYIAQLSWGAIGYSPAASYGVKLALEDQDIDRRVISISGDGAISESINTLGTIAQLGLNNVIFVMANGVFAIEQFLVNAEAFSDQPGSPDFEALTQVPQTEIWNWVKLAEGFGGIGYEVTTNKELESVLNHLRENPSPPAKVPAKAQTCPSGQCQFEGQTAVAGKSTFTLIAVRNVCKDLPGNVRWKIDPGE